MKANQVTYPIATMCHTLGVSPSGYYAWTIRLPSKRAIEDAAMTERIRAFHARSRGTYGDPRIHQDLFEEGDCVGRKRIARLMRQAGLHGVSRRKGCRTTIRNGDACPAPDLVERNFTVTAPDQLWVADITYIPTWAGFLYLAVVLDAFSRRIVGWAMETHLRTELVLDALNMALWRRRPSAVIHHSDQGCQGGFNWSSQHLNKEELRWEQENVDGLIVLDVLQCARLVGRRWGGVSTGINSGRPSPVGCQARMLQGRPAFHRLSERGGSARVAGCHQSIWPRCRGAICRSPSERRSRSCTRAWGPVR